MYDNILIKVESCLWIYISKKRNCPIFRPIANNAKIKKQLKDIIYIPILNCSFLIILDISILKLFNCEIPFSYLRYNREYN